MTVELNPVGVTCNLSCPYCYEHPMRDAGNFNAGSYNMEAMKKGLTAEGADFTLFGGEPLLMKFEDLEEIWRWGLEKFKKNGIQTNAALITDRHIGLFLKYKVQVGVSMDGPEEMNDSRWAGSEEKTREATRKSQAAVEKMLEMGVEVSLIVTLHRGNALPENRPRLKAWLRGLESRGLKYSRLHLLEIDHPLVEKSMDLTSAEAIEVMLDLANFESEGKLKFDAFADIVNLLQGTDKDVTCIWNACDPYTTNAVRGVDGDGMRSNCGRATKEGINWRKADQRGYERQLALYHTPYESGGCQDCRFFVMCKGQCPGTGIDGDWRNRSAQCKTWLSLFEHVERRMVAEKKLPLSLNPIRVDVEKLMLEQWSQGRNIRIATALEKLKNPNLKIDPDAHGDTPHGDSHGDSTHGDSPHLDSSSPHNDTPHGDYTDPSHPYGDVAHGDSPPQILGVAPVGRPK